MKVIEAIRDYISNCPALETFNINVNYLEDDFDSYSIEETPCDPILRRYIDGTTLRQIEFVFASREVYTSDILSNIDNSSFYEDFSNWIKNEILEAGNFVLVSGSDITKYYNEENYYEVKGTLGNSCMRHSECRTP